MSSNFEILTQKFESFKKIILENSKSPKVSILSNYNNTHFLGYSAVLLKMKEQQKLQEIVDKTVDELKMDKIHKDKIMRYFLCFIDYLELMIKEDPTKLDQNKDESK
jgi:hypothetical protein